MLPGHGQPPEHGHPLYSPEHQPILGPLPGTGTGIATGDFPPAAGRPMGVCSGHGQLSSLSVSSTTPVRSPSLLARARRWLSTELNFYRCHLLAFTVIPFVFAIVFSLAHNLGQSPSQRPNFVDCLFMCYSAMTMTGLNTILLGSLNRFQQVLLYILMSIGSTTMVSIIMICIRLRAFKLRFRDIRPPALPLRISRPFPLACTPPQLKSMDTFPVRASAEARLSSCHRPSRDSNRPFVTRKLADGPDYFTDHSQEPHLAQWASQPCLQQQPLPELPEESSFNEQIAADRNSPQRSTSVRPPATSPPAPPSTSTPKLVRRNSDGGVVGALNVSRLSTTFEDPSHSSANLIPFPSILQSSPAPTEPKSPWLPRSLDLKSATKSNIIAKRAEKYFPRASTFDQARSLKQVCDFRRRPVWRTKDRRSLFGIAHKPEWMGRQTSTVSSGQTVVNRSLDDEIQAVGLSAQDSILQTASSRPFSSAQGQVGFADQRAEGAGRDDMQPIDNLHRRPGVRRDSLGLAQQFRFAELSAEGSDAIQADDALEGPRIRRLHARNPSAATLTRQSGRRSCSLLQPPPTRHLPRQHSMSAQSATPSRKSRRTSHGSLRRRPSLDSFGGFPHPGTFLLSRLIKLLNRHWPWQPQQHSLQFVRTNSVAGNVLDEDEKRKLSEGLFGRGRGRAAEAIQNVKTVSYITFNAIVGRNSNFLTLTSAQEEELGGLEYRALALLLKVVMGYWLGCQLVAIVILIPWIESGKDGKKRYDEVFEGPGGTGRLWYVIWITCSSFTNGGMSLIDASFTVLQDAHLLMIICSFLIVAGNTGFPVILRAILWLLSKLSQACSPTDAPGPSRVGVGAGGQGHKEVLGFLLDHPRRCFIYLFPSRETWHLLGILGLFTGVDWVLFLVLDVGNSVVEKIPVGTRILDGLLQSLSVRAAGFSVVALNGVAPALQVLYIIMMYIAAYPVAMSIRSTNVYEERSLGIFSAQDRRTEGGGGRTISLGGGGERSSLMSGHSPGSWHEEGLHGEQGSVRRRRGPGRRRREEVNSGGVVRDSESSIESGTHDEEDREDNGDGCDEEEKRAMEGGTRSYLAFHIRKQLAFDIWWLALALWIICIFERRKIYQEGQAVGSSQVGDEKSVSFSIFSIMFELVSAYGTIGLSFGLPNSPTSMVGGFTSWSKLVVILVMVRGRHRGLPIAIDRAVLLPCEQRAGEGGEEEGEEEEEEDEGGKGPEEDAGGLGEQRREAGRR